MPSVCVLGGGDVSSPDQISSVLTSATYGLGGYPNSLNAPNGQYLPGLFVSNKSFLFLNNPIKNHVKRRKPFQNGISQSSGFWMSALFAS